VVKFTPGHFTPEERTSGTHWTRDWVDSRAGLDALESRHLFPVLQIEPRFVGSSRPSGVTVPVGYLTTADITQCVVRLWDERVRSDEESSVNNAVGVSEESPDKPHKSRFQSQYVACRRFDISTFFSVHCINFGIDSCKCNPLNPSGQCMYHPLVHKQLSIFCSVWFSQQPGIVSLQYRINGMVLVMEAHFCLWHTNWIVFTCNILRNSYNVD
jgi:hypothetical protein